MYLIQVYFTDTNLAALAIERDLRYDLHTIAHSTERTTECWASQVDE